MNYYSEKMIAMAAVREASDLCRTVQQELKGDSITKMDKSPVTVADFGSQALVCSRIRSAYPDDPIIAEETSFVLRRDENRGDRQGVVQRVRLIRPDATEDEVLEWIDYGGHKDQSNRFWTLDPIDGTKGFMRGDQYAIALALIVDAEVVVAALACPNLTLASSPEDKGVVAVAVKGEGTEIYRLSDMELIGKAEVSAQTDPAGVRFSESVESSHTSHTNSQKVADLLGISQSAIRLDSQAKYVVVAAGDAEIYLRMPSSRRYVENIWDHAGGMLIVQEAGGKVTDIHGKDLVFKYGYQLKENRGIVVSNGGLHDSILKAIESTTLVG
ncbi:MAG: 3'(2'),5'-bisphosphate nucleotidase [Bacteroidetes bacterium]|nr:3'(2'),5'-bisphosphate nucleotidase [Bacteroidota bacterium]